jgi:hypothetical protein
MDDDNGALLLRMDWLVPMLEVVKAHVGLERRARDVAAMDILMLGYVDSLLCSSVIVRCLRRYGATDSGAFLAMSFKVMALGAALSCGGGGREE